MTTRYGGVDRSHDRSLGPKLAFAALHGGIVAGCLWLGFGGIDWVDPMRAQLLALCALLYWLRHLLTLFVLLQRRVELNEVLGLAAFMALFEIGFLLLGAGVLADGPRPLGLLDGLGLGLLLAGSLVNSTSEVQRHLWKRQPEARGRCYTGGLFAWSMHINYFGDSLLFTGWAILAASVWALSIPLMMTVMFVVFHIPPLDAYLAQKYGDEFRAYAGRTAKFVPFLY